MAPKTEVKAKRGAKASRSSFRAKPKPKPKLKPKRQPALRVNKRATATKRKRAAAGTSKPEPIRPSTDGRLVLGDILVPSGQLAIFDIGLVGYLPRPALDPMIVKADVPRDRPLQVVGAKIGRGRFADCWDHVAIVLADERADEQHASSSRDGLHHKKLGDAAVDFARLVAMDLAALDAWQHEDSLDGRADFVFWGRDEAKLARLLAAPRRPGEGYGWTDLALADAEAKADLAAKYKAENKWLLAMDLRPHSHHFQALAAARKHPLRAGTLDLVGSRLLLFFTSWGDGVFPIYLDRDADDRAVQIRIQLATPESSDAMAMVNP